MRSTAVLAGAAALLLASGVATAQPTHGGAAPTPPSGATVATTEQEVTFAAGARTVHGTLTVPSSPGRHAAVLLIAGSGPTDRDWNSPLIPGRNGSGRLIAQALAARGYVVLRYDKLGTGQTAAPATVAWSDYTAEQVAALGLLRAHASVDPAHVFVAGHSEGGAHAIRLLAHLPAGQHVAGLILLSSLGRSTRNTIYAQLETQFRAAGVTGAQLAGFMQPIGAAMDAIGAGRPANLEAVQPPNVRAILGAFVTPQAGSFGRELLVIDPTVGIRDVRVPVLVINGGRDMQISPTLDGQPLVDAARAAGNHDVTQHVVALANHVFKREDTPLASLDAATATAHYNAADRVLDPDLEATITAWLASHGAR